MLSTAKNATPHQSRPVSRGGATGAIAPPKMNPGCTLLSPYQGGGATGCNRCKCEIKAHLVEILVENRLWSKRARKYNIFPGTWPLGHPMGRYPWTHFVGWRPQTRFARPVAPPKMKTWLRPWVSSAPATHKSTRCKSPDPEAADSEGQGEADRCIHKRCHV